MFRELLLILSATFMLILAPGATVAQQTDLKITEYKESNGLSSRIIRCVLQDSRGLMWFGTPDGLNSYDGYTFTTYRRQNSDRNSLSSNFITNLAEDSQGNIWTGHLYGGITRYHTSTGIFTRYPLRTASPEAAPVREVTMLHADAADNIWIGIANDGLYRLAADGREIKHYDINPLETSDRTIAVNTVHCLAERGGEGFFLGTQRGLFAFDTATGSAALIEVGASNEHAQPAIITMAQENDVLWLGTWGSGLYAYNVHSGASKNFKADARFSVTSNIIPGLCHQGSDTLWFASNDKGPGFFRKSTQRFYFMNREDGPATGEFKQVYKDRAGNVWIAYDDGLLKVWTRPQKFVFNELPVQRSDNNNLHWVNSYFENENLLIIGSCFGDGLQVTDKRSKRKKTIAFDVLPGNETGLWVSDIIEDKKGKIWVLTRDHLFLLDQKHMTLLKPSFNQELLHQGKTSFLLRLHDDRNGNIWITSDKNGAFLLDPSTGRIVQHYNAAGRGNFYIPSNSIKAIASDDKGNIWLGGGNSFLGVLDRQTNGFINVTVADEDREIRGGSVSDIVMGKEGAVWAGTDAGLFKFQQERDSFRLKKIFDAEQGIRSDLVKSMAMDNDGNIWCLTQTSLCKLDPDNDKVFNFGMDDGLDNPYIGNRLINSGGKEMVLTSQRGYYVFHPQKVISEPQPPALVITSLKVNGRQRFYGSDIANFGRIKFSADENLFSFEFANIDFNRVAPQQYAFMLEGFDKEWIVTQSRYASYSHLPAGDYTFMVRTINHYDVGERTLHILPIHVDNYFYQTWWFRLTAVAAFALFTYLFYLGRIRNRERIYSLQSKATELQKEKAMVMYESLKQQLNPHFLFNSLTSLSSLIRIDQKMAGEFLDGLSKSYRYILKNRENQLVSLKEEVRFTETYLKLQKARFENGLLINFNIDDELNDMQIAPVTLQNLVENAIKHNIISTETPLMIDIYTENNFLVVKNNLNKKQFVETSNRQGLGNLRSLYSYLSGRPVEIRETRSHFTIVIPLL